MRKKVYFVNQNQVEYYEKRKDVWHRVERNTAVDWRPGTYQYIEQRCTDYQYESSKNGLVRY